MSSSLTPLLDLLLPAMFGGSQPPRTEVELPLAGLKEDDRDEDWAPLAPPPAEKAGLGGRSLSGY